MQLPQGSLLRGRYTDTVQKSRVQRLQRPQGKQLMWALLPPHGAHGTGPRASYPPACRLDEAGAVGPCQHKVQSAQRALDAVQSQSHVRSGASLHSEWAAEGC